MMSAKEAREKGGKTFREQWGPALLALLLGCAGLIVATVHVLGVGGLIAEGPIVVGLLYVFSKAAVGEKIQYMDLLYGFKTNFGEIVLGSLIKFAILAGIGAAAYGIIATFAAIFFFVRPLVIVLGILVGIAAVIAEIIVALQLGLVEYILMREPEQKGWEAVKKSRLYMAGRSGKLFGFDLSFLGWIILTIVFFPLAVYTAPYYFMSRVYFLESIYEDAERREKEMAMNPDGSEATRFCKHCGKPIAEDAVYCSHCGKPQ